MKYDAIIFDLDGTLWNSSQSCTKAWNMVLKRLAYKMRITIQDMNSVSGRPIDECIDNLLPGIRQKHGNIKELLTVSEQNYIERYGATIYKDVSENIVKLTNFYKLFIVSNCQEWYLIKFLQKSKLLHILSGWDCFGKSQQEKSKMLMTITKDNHIKNAVYVGDTIHDKESANQANMDFIQVTYGFGYPIETAIRFNNFKYLCKFFIKIA